MEKRVEVVDHSEAERIVVRENPGALSKVVKNKASFYKWPGSKDVYAPNMTHIGVERLGTGCTQKYVAEHHKASSVYLVVKQKHDAAKRVERTQHRKVGAHIKQA